MNIIKGPAIFLAQFAGTEAPYNTLDGMCGWVSKLGYKGIQIPTWETGLIDLDLAASSQTYCDELKGKVASYGLEITELSTHLQGQLVAVNPAYDSMFDNFAPDAYKNNPKARTAWAVDQLKKAAIASKNLGITAHATFSGSLMWHTMYPWPQAPKGLVEMGFKELADRWMPILNTFDENGVDVCYEIHPGEDLHDGVTFERFLKATNNHQRVNILYDPSHFVLQQLDYLKYIDYYHEYIKMFHVKDAEFNASGKTGVYGGYQDWKDRAGRFRSLGDGQVDFKSIFSKLTQYNCNVWAVMEWECCLKSPEQGAKEGAPFISQHLIDATEKGFDDFAGGAEDPAALRKILGI
ncbi:sugar phosphate isomerase/epimerase family protein [Wenyingzhuangia aestuarii]|uniref:sugar phosphate isomerase/epimerase family protein n=1 Tax=Wenyingzhuangia aestuarii TaxID=1647582 RepID=UPI0014388ED0|nr:sugar phosphate isomerase/epimerase [Wenyingzhuangia aestuarii]NJB82749.1 sugar phosphate isomerase/epimerase [Wenyingzhuangia aestuarii]